MALFESRATSERDAALLISSDKLLLLVQIVSK